jgi:hypothetical protein
MSSPDLDPDLAAALEVLAELGPLQILDVQPTPPGHRPAPPLGPASAPAMAAPLQPSLFEPHQPPVPVLANPLGHLPSNQRWRAVLRTAGAPLSPTPPTWRSHP